jgi:hypothetical protein
VPNPPPSLAGARALRAAVFAQHWRVQVLVQRPPASSLLGEFQRPSQLHSHCLYRSRSPIDTHTIRNPSCRRCLTLHCVAACRLHALWCARHGLRHSDLHDTEPGALCVLQTVLSAVLGVAENQLMLDSVEDIRGPAGASTRRHQAFTCASFAQLILSQCANACSCHSVRTHDVGVDSCGSVGDAGGDGEATAGGSRQASL